MVQDVDAIVSPQERGVKAFRGCAQTPPNEAFVLTNGPFVISFPGGFSGIVSCTPGHSGSGYKPFLMLRFSLLILTALTASAPASTQAQPPRGGSVASVLPFPDSQDSIRIWHRHLNDSTLGILLPVESNHWLAKGYEFVVPLGSGNAGPVRLTAALPHPDSLHLSCATTDYLCSGYKLFFSRDRDGFSVYGAADFQIFRSGIERICDVPLRLRMLHERVQVSPARGRGACWYVYQRKLLVSVPETGYRLP